MFGVLLESRARVQRRGGGVALSVAAHVALISVATAATVHARPEKTEKPEPVFVQFTAPPPPKPVPVQHEPSTAPVVKLASTPSIPVIDLVAPPIVPPTLPPINPGGTPTPDGPVMTRGGSGGQPGYRSAFDAGPAESSTDWRGTEVLMHILNSGKPRYPDLLRQAGVDGSVLIQFTVDTLGRVDMQSVKVLSSTHNMFTDAVRQSLGAFRFKPAEVNGKRVPALAQMPFEFHLSK
jgi:periplasmic protein TonB